MKTERFWIYLMTLQLEDSEIIKIGYSKHPEIRFKQNQIFSGAEGFKVLELIFFTNRNHAQKYEKVMHDYFNKSRKGRISEWYQYDKDIIRLFKSMKRGIYNQRRYYGFN